MLLALALACVPAETAPPTFDEALRLGFQRFSSGSDEELAEIVLSMEQGLLTDMNLDSEAVEDRSFTQSPLSEEDLMDVSVPDRDPSLALATVVARQSAFTRAEHEPVALLTDHTGLEPQCREHYVRSFVEGEDCWPDCILRTENDLTKVNLLMTASYVLPKDYRTVPLGDERVAQLARTWTRERVIGESGDVVIEQSETVELWLDREGHGAMRMMAVWAETTFGDVVIDDELVLGTMRMGTDDIFEFQDEWMASH